MRLVLCLFLSSLAFAQAPAQPPAATPPKPPPAAAPQTPPPAAPGAKPDAAPEPAPQAREAEPPTYVRRISAGLTASFFPLTLTSGGATRQVFNEPALEVRSEAIQESSWFGGGVTFQVALSDRFALNASALIRRAGFILTTQNFLGFDNPATWHDERIAILGRDDTRTSYLDIPLLVRRYNIERQEPGHRWFYEFGPSIRRVWSVRSSRESTRAGITTCCDETPAIPSSSMFFGFTAGVGFQLIDDFGIRVVPGVRYTRWLASAFDTLGARDRRHQVEIHLSLGF
jgi:hypothetical protein